MPSGSRVKGPLTSALAGQIKEARLEQGRTQREVAERAGLVVNTYNAIERGVKSVDVEQLDQIGRALHLVPSELLLKATARMEGRDGVSLSAREVDVLKSLAKYGSTKRIGRDLSLSQGTVNTYLARLRTKYANVNRFSPTRADLVINGLRDGIIGFSDLSPEGLGEDEVDVKMGQLT